MTISTALDAAVKRLHNHSSSPRLDAEVLLGHILQQNRASVLANSHTTLKPKHVSRFQSLLVQRAKRVPIPYLTGQTEFYNLPFRVSPAVLVPRPFTETLLDSVIGSGTILPNDVIIDIGTGSGAIAITLAVHAPLAKIIGTDISHKALRVAQGNAKRLLPKGRIRWFHGSLLQALPRTVHPTVIIANLPYLAARQLREPSLRHEPKLALYGGLRGLVVIKKVLQQVSNYPEVRMIALEIDPSQVSTVKKLLRRWSSTVRLTSVSDGRNVRGIVAVR